MNEIILDSSAVLAFLYQELGADIVDAEKGHVAISTVNLAEVFTKLIEDKVEKDMADNTVAMLNLTIVPFDEEMAYERKKNTNRSIKLKKN